jgi:2-alkyl-3-oxoalkanoate reductase
MNILVTGGGGFLGKALVKRLLSEGHKVRSFARGAYPELEALGVDVVRGDLTKYESIYTALEGCELVYHVAAKAGVWGSYESYYDANVLGSENILKACRAHGIRYLVNTSSPSVIFDGDDQEGLDESAPYPATYLSNYPKTKAMAERLVMEASDSELLTISLRPHLIWGPEDTQLIPRVVEQGSAGKLRFVGCGTKLIDAVYIDNAVEAHVCAAEALMESGSGAGKTYFITNDEPWAFDKILNGILNAADVLPVRKRISAGLAYRIGAVLEMVYSVLGKEDEPRMTRFIALQLATAHWYDISAAQRDLGYRPIVSMDEGFKRLTQWFSDQKKKVEHE